jgi:hypothetical protein
MLALTFNPTTSSAKEVAPNKAICSSQVYAHPTKDGYTWTLASRLGQLIDLAESEYGERDNSWTILGTEFTNENQPSNWHPGGFAKKKIVFLLTPEAANNKKEAMYQLAHEVIHALSPNNQHDANYFEEGIAVFFAIHATQKMGFSITPRYISSKKYKKAYELINAIYTAHPDAGKRISQARKSGYLFSTMEAKQLLMLFPEISPSGATQLAEKF